MSGPAKDAKWEKIGNRLFVCLFVISVFVPIVYLAFNATSDDGDATVYTGGLFDRDGAAHLVDRLRTAADAQGICYGWAIDTDLPDFRSSYPDTGAVTTPAPAPTLSAPSELEQRLRELERQAVLDLEPDEDVGSNLGAGVDARRDPVRCPRWVVFTADYSYSSYEEEWTAVSTRIETNLPLTLDASDLHAAGITDDDLLGMRPYARLADAIGALPMIVAEKGAADPVPAPPTRIPSAGDTVSPPGIGRYIWMGIGGLLVALGLTWIIVAALRSRRSA